MATFPDLAGYDHYHAQVLAGDPLVLPIRGRTYSFDPRKLTTGAFLRMQRVQAESVEIARKLAVGEKIDPNVIVMTDEEEEQFGRELLGEDMLAQLAADGVLWAETQHLMNTVMAYCLYGEKAAHAIWAGEEAKPADPPARAASTKTAGSSTTRKTPAKPRSGGRKSSATGTSSRRTSTASTKST